MTTVIPSLISIVLVVIGLFRPFQEKVPLASISKAEAEADDDDRIEFFIKTIL